MRSPPDARPSLLDQYDAEGNITTVTSVPAPQDTLGDLLMQDTYTYDNLGRKASHTVAHGPWENTSYDLNGNVISSSRPSGTLTMQYDALDRLRQRRRICQQLEEKCYFHRRRFHTSGGASLTSLRPVTDGVRLPQPTSHRQQRGGVTLGRGGTPAQLLPFERNDCLTGAIGNL